AFEPLEVAGKAGPIAVEAFGHRRIEKAVVGLAADGRRGRHPAITGDLGGDALRHRRGGTRFESDGEIRMRVRVDQPGRDAEVRGIDAALGRRAVETSDRDDAIALDADIGPEPRRAGAVDDAAVLDDEVEHRRVLRASRTSARTRPSAAAGR